MPKNGQKSSYFPKRSSKIHYGKVVNKMSAVGGFWVKYNKRWPQEERDQHGEYTPKYVHFPTGFRVECGVDDSVDPIIWYVRIVPPAAEPLVYYEGTDKEMYRVAFMELEREMDLRYRRR